jgi:hypothetical protein
MPAPNITITIPMQPFVAVKNVTAFDNYVTRELKAVTGEPHCQLKDSTTQTYEVGELLYRPQVMFTDAMIEATIPTAPMTIVFEPYTDFA